MKFETFLFVLFVVLKNVANALSSEEITEVTETCCSHGETVAARSSSVQQCARASSPEDIEPEQVETCMAALKGCCEQHFTKKEECSAGIKMAPAKRCTVPKTDVGKTCCDECTIGRLTGESQGRESCGDPAGDDVSPTTALRKNAYHQCCLEAANKPETTTEKKIETTTAKKVTTTRKARERCREDSCEHLCNDGGGKITCQCHEGYRLMANKKSCKDINECAEAIDDLCVAEGTVCHNTPGAFKCVPIRKREVGLSCPAGFQRNVVNQVCDDINECQLPRPPCPKFLCENTVGGYKCRGKPGKPFEEAIPGVTTEPAASSSTAPANEICPQGFRAGPDDECIDIDECEERLDDCQRLSQYCINSHGGFFCQDHVSKRCAPGFKVDSTTGICEDIDECEEADTCRRNEICVNRPGEYTCKSKISTLPKLGGKKCQEGTRMRPGGNICEDIDECREGTHLCDQFQNCINTFGAHECRCKNGYEVADSSGSCVDVDECARNLDNCAQGTYCVNVLGGFSCKRQAPTTPSTPNVYDYESYDDDEDNTTINDNNRETIPDIPLPTTTSRPRPRPYPFPQPTTSSTTPSPPPLPPLPPRPPAYDTTTTRRPYTSRPRPTRPPYRPTSPRRPETDSSRTPYPEPPVNNTLEPEDRRPEPKPPVENTPDPRDRRPDSRDRRPDPEPPIESTPNPRHRRPDPRDRRPDPEPPVDNTLDPEDRRSDPEQPTEDTPDPRNRRPVSSRPDPRDRRPDPDTPVVYTPNPRERTTDPRDRTTDPRDRTPDPRDPTPVPRDRVPDPRDRLPDSRRPGSEPPVETTPDPRDGRPDPKRPDHDRPVEVTVPAPKDPVTIEKEKDPDGSYHIDTSDLPKNNWTNVVGTDAERPENEFDPNLLHCLNGYERNAAGDCVDVDECESKRHICSNLEECENRPAGYVCNCIAGFERDSSGWCAPTPTSTSTSRPTTTSTTETPTNVETPRPYTPKPRPRPSPEECELGYKFDSRLRKCVDIDECSTNKASCSETEECVNKPGGYRCVCGRRCRPEPGRSGHGTPHRPPGNSNPNVITVGTQYGSRGPQHRSPNYAYRRHEPVAECPWGYKLTSDNNTCYDIDECEKRVSECGPEQRCENFFGGYSCQCPTGHRISGQDSCEDIDECSYAQPCPYNAQCVNTVGSYRCACGAGFRNAPSNEKVCVDVDECAESPHVCEQGCANAWGGYRCYCKKGYRLSRDNSTCEDIDECAEWAAARHRGRLCGGDCANEPGSYRCACPHGYRLSDDGRSCIDIDECDTGEARCAHAAPGEVCQNTRGSYHCHRINCPDGYALESKHRCTRIQRSCPVRDHDCIHQPSAYSYNFITFVANIYLPEGSVDLFTMHGPAWRDASVTFELRMIDVQASRGVRPADLQCFDMRPSHNVCRIALRCSLQGPQVAELELSMSLFQFGRFAGSAAARLVVIVSEYEF